MKLNIDPMPVLRRAKADEITLWFNSLAHSRLHVDAAYAHKREVAKAVMSGKTPTDEFQAEADMRNMHAGDLAQLVLSKPNVVAKRELYRQQLLSQVAAAKTPDDLNAIKCEVSNA